MSSEAYPRYVRPNRGKAAISSSSSTSVATVLATVHPEMSTPAATSSKAALQRGSAFQDLIRELAESLAVLGPFGLSSICSLLITGDEPEPLQFLGKGKTFYVSKIKLPVNVKIERSWTTKLVPPGDISPPERFRWVEPGRGIITCKRPLIELDEEGNTKDSAADERVRAVKLELQILTHPWLYLHKNIVDFLGIKWECNLPDFEPGSIINSGPIMRIPTILLEYAEHGSLDSFHRTKHYKTLSLGIRAKICRDVAEGLHALHESGIVHGDVKLDNVLIFDEYDDHGGRVAFGLRAKLTDFGFSVKRSDESCAETDQGPMWRLKGRTWPWNDPGWQSLRTWSQLEKSDVFSYGLLAWSVLTGEEIGNLFDLDGITIKDHLELRKTVDDMKDVILGRNAANSFLEEDTSVQLFTACLFDCALNPYVETRGTMGKVLEIWNTWYFGDPPSLSLPPGITIGPPVDVEDHKRVNFHRIVREMTEFPLSIKQQYLKALTVLDDGEESSKAILFRAFAHLVGWGVERNPEESKRILDSEYRIADVAIFKAMFLPIATTEERNLAMVYGQKCEPYEQEIAIKLLFTVRTSPSCEPVAQLRKYFPFPITGIGNGIYGTMRCRTYRTWKYNIDREDHPINHQKERGGELYAHELQDIWTKQPTINPGIGHNELHFAVFSGFAEAIKIMIDSDDFERLSLESKDYNGDTPLLSACRHGLFTIAELLIKAGANVKARNSYGETTLHFLDDFGDPEELTEISALLFKHGAADLINANCEGRSYPLAPTSLMPNLKGTPLNTAVMRNNLVLIRILLKRGADPFGLSSPIDSPSPAKVAASGHFIEILELFWKANPSDRNWANPNNKLLLHAIGGLSEVQRIYFHATRAKEMMQRTLRFLLDRAVLSYGKITFDGRPLLHVAAEHGTPDMLAFIISYVGNSDINIYEQNSKTPVHTAIQNGAYDIFQVLLENGADVTLPVQGPMGSISILEYCCISSGDVTNIIRSVLDINPYSKDTVERTRIGPAISTCNFEAASLLLERGVDIDWSPGDKCTVIGFVILNCTTNAISQLKFLLDHQLAIGKRPASFLCFPSSGKTALHAIALLPLKSPLYDQSLPCNILDYLLHRFPSPEQINAIDIDGDTALHLAAYCGNFQMVQKLLEIDLVRCDIKNRQNQTAYQLAERELVKEIPKKIKELGPRVVERYKGDRVEVMNLFLTKFGDGSYYDFDEVEAVAVIDLGDGTGRNGHLVLAR